MKDINKYMYESFLLFKTMNLVDKFEIEISEQDMEILKAYHKTLKRFEGIDFELFLDIIKKLSIDYTRTPVDICSKIYNDEKTNYKEWQSK